MDAALLSMMRSGGRNQAWAETMVNLEARKLVDVANRVASFHLNHGLSRIQFVEEIKKVIEDQFALARRASSDEDCMACVSRLRAEAASLNEQDRLLRTQVARLYAKVEFVHENDKIVGYVISAVKIVLSGLTLVGGVAMVASMNPIGMLAGATLFIDGINGITREASHLMYGNSVHSEGIFADGAMGAAKFMGFRPETGLAAYKAATLASSVYGIAGAFRKPEAWRLFRWLPTDYFRKIDTMDRSQLTMKIVNYGVKARVIFELLHDSKKSDQPR
ncbi:DUF4225 domain-containing protein [Pantoea ananatis]|nr:DUF4225 domain-containing protein [Pantoea ananatis]CCF11157.1 hypothetical protein PANA5342_3764 [Pantoea ananatis LMG 5342]